MKQISNENCCVICGTEIPEGRQVCPICESKYTVVVRHGEWVTDKGTFDLCGIEHYNCSVCGGQTQVKYPNCPWCIAKMDGKGEGE